MSIRKFIVFPFALISLTINSQADQVVLDDLIATQSTCLGNGCTETENYEFDTLRIKSDNPRVRFTDTSTSAAFPTNDWAFGFTDENSAVTPYFYIENVDAAKRVLHIEGGEQGAIAIGADATAVAGSISVGNATSQRRVSFVAPGTLDSDAATMAQFSTFTATIENDIEADKQALNAKVQEMQQQVSSLNQKLETLINRLDALQK